eukprot:GSA25T00010715001.1
MLTQHYHLTTLHPPTGLFFEEDQLHDAAVQEVVQKNPVREVQEKEKEGDLLVQEKEDDFTS